MSPLIVPPVQATAVLASTEKGEPGRGGTTTVTVAVPEIEPLAALTVLLNVPATPPAVKRPVPELMVPPPFMTDQTKVSPVRGLPLASRPTAVNCWVAPAFTVAGFGDTTMLDSAPAVTLTVAVPEIEPLVALTVLLYVPGTVPAVKRPVLALMVPPPFTTDHT